MAFFWCQSFFSIILMVEKCAGAHFDIWNKKNFYTFSKVSPIILLILKNVLNPFWTLCSSKKSIDQLEWFYCKFQDKEELFFVTTDGIEWQISFLKVQWRSKKGTFCQKITKKKLKRIWFWKKKSSSRQNGCVIQGSSSSSQHSW